MPRTVTGRRLDKAVRAEEEKDFDPFPAPTGFDSRTLTIRSPEGKRIPISHPVFKNPPNDEEWAAYYLPNSILPTKTQEWDEKTGQPLIDSRTRRKVMREIKPQFYKVQRDISDFLDAHTWAKVEIFRGAGKSIVSLIKILRKICDNPEERLFFQSEVEAKTVQRIHLIKIQLQVNQRLIKDYGYLPSDEKSEEEKANLIYGKAGKGKWSQLIIDLKRTYIGIEPTIMGFSWQSSGGVGYHFTGGILDDPWSEKSQGEKNAYEKFWNWWGEFVGSLEQVTFVWVLCTKKGKNDIYKGMDDEKLFATYRQPLILVMPKEEDIQYVEDSGGAIVGTRILNKDPTIQYVYDDCFGKYSIERACLIRKRGGKIKFEREYNLKIIPPEGKFFQWTNLRWCNPSENALDPYSRIPYIDLERRRMRLIGIYDPSFGQSERAANNALIIMGEYQNRYYIIDAWVGHWSRQTRITAFQECIKKYPGLPIYIEEDFMQAKIVIDLLGYFANQFTFRGYRARGQNTKYRDFFAGEGENAGKKAKIADAFERPWDGSTYCLPDLPYLDEFEEEVKTFPDCERFDIIDAVAMGFLILINLIISSEGGVSSKNASPNLFIRPRVMAKFRLGNN